MKSKCEKCGQEIDWKKCFMCGKDVDGNLLRATIPKEIFKEDDFHVLIEDLHPICNECEKFRNDFDYEFIQLCYDMKLFEWYRAKSNKRGEFFPSQLVYNIDVRRIKNLYYTLMEICAEGYDVSLKDDLRQQREDELNYIWRKKDA
jgi:hypothetical protein